MVEIYTHFKAILLNYFTIIFLSFIGGAAASSSGAPPPPTGANVVQARNAKKNALEEFAKENNLKPESIKKAYKRLVVALSKSVIW